jgi:RNA polymerase sigma factor (sigma-70 family)
MTRATLRSVEAPSTGERDDGDVVLRRLGDGDTSALGVAFDRYHRDVYNFLARLRGNRNDLDDLVQMTFLALPTAASHFDGRGTPRAFVLGVAFQVARRERRRVFRRFALWVARESDIDVPEGPLDPERNVLEREAMARYETALAKLPEAQRETFVLVEVEGLKGEEAAQILGVPLNTVWTRLHHARLALREKLRPRGAR